MAKLERELRGSFDAVLNALENEVMRGSISASLEDGSDFRAGDARCAVRVFERYSAFGGNRVSLSVTLFESGGRLFVSAVSSGGSQAMFFKVNTFGEQAFLDTLRGVINRF